ncbi:MAG: hypothetical protein J5708_07345 [Bacteroidales bacterium]|nr:hypothetical protein [Bacteroidales bacterium]
MKKILLVLTLVLTMSVNISAQSDWFVGGSDYSIRNEDLFPILLAGNVGSFTDDEPAPVGSGLLVLTLLGAGYAVSKKRRF